MPRSRCASLTDPRLVGDPVDTCKGAAVDQTLDFRLTGSLEFWWVRHYDSSQSHRRFALGWGHTHDFDRTLRFDADGLSYWAPLGHVIGFPPLQHDGNTAARDGYTLRRISLLRYELYRHSEPAMEFEFRNLQHPARLKRLFRRRAEIRFGYDGAGQWERIVDSVGREIRVIEGADGRIASLTLEGGRGKPSVALVSYQYDERGNLIATTDSSGHGFAHAYDAANRMVRRTGRKGFCFHFSYDIQGRCIKSSGDGRMHEVDLAYDPSGRVTTVTRADGGVWTYLFDEHGGLMRIVDPLGGMQQFLRGETGRVELELDPTGNATRLVYDAAGGVVAKITPFGRRMSIPEDPNAPDPRAHRVAGNPAEYEYGRLLEIYRIVLPDRREAALLPISSDARTMVVTRGEEKGVSAGQEPPPRPLGPIWWPKPKQGRVFNDLGKLVQQDDDWGRRRQWSYDASGNVTQYVDFDGGKWLYDLGNWHLRLAETNPLEATVRFSYNTTGEVASCTDAGGTRSDYGYNQKDHLVEVRRHGVIRDRYTRDAAGNLIAKHAGDGRLLLQFEIGPGNVPIKRTLSSGDEHTFEYNESGEYLVAATRKDRVEFGYDALGNRCLEKRNGRGVEHRFAGWHMPAESVFFEQFVVRYERGAGGTLTIKDPGGRKHQIRLHPHGLVERRFSNGSNEAAQYDSQGRCLFKCAQRVSGRSWSRGFDWSGEGELRRVRDNRYGETRHEYDAAHRLCRRILPDGRTEEYEVDVADNVVRQPGLDGVSLQQGNRLSAANAQSVSYNDRNHVAVRQTQSGPVQYIYDSRDQLIRVETPQGGWDAEYDALGRRTRKTWAGKTTEYYWNTDQLIAEVAAERQLRLYIYADPLALTPLMFVDYDSVEASAESCRRYFIFTDQIGTACVVEDESGAEVWRASIDPYGRAHVVFGAKIEFNLRFPGHYFDSEIGLHYNRFRYFDPLLARYLQSDPWGLAGGYNLYAYRANPLLEVDVRGLGEEDDPESQCRQEDEEGIPRSSTPDEEPGLPRLGQQEGQDIVDTIHGALPEDSIAARNSTTTLTETEDGTLIVTNSDRVTPEMRQTIAEMQEPGQPLDGRTVLIPDDRNNPGYIRDTADRDLPPQGPNGTPTGAENHGEQRGIQAANYYDEHGDQNGQGHGPADTQWSRSEAGHQGQACPDCAAAQQQNNVHNPTGVDPDP